VDTVLDVTIDTCGI